MKDTHKCIQTRDLTGVTSRFLSPYAIEILKRNRGKVDVSSLQLELSQKFQINISYDKAYRAKQFAEQFMTGDHKEQYAQLRDYAMELR